MKRSPVTSALSFAVALLIITAGATPSAASDSCTSGVPSKFSHRLQMMAEGAVPTAYVLAVPLPVFPPLPPGLEFRARQTFPYAGRDVLDTLVFVAPQSLPVGVFDPEQAPEAVISRFLTRIDAVEIAGGEAYEQRGLEGGLVMLGPILCMLNPSPFGDLTGLVSTYGTGFISGEDASFRLEGGSAAGDHATFAPTAAGYLRIRGHF